ncbi:MAG: peptidoglycan -binding protein [Rhodospirillaceae bacterium]|nr:MAG: peptidoglycan -binding protein [Rhodospirillaceae bacterium]
MPAFARRARRTVDIWPGWVDALSTLLIIIIFVLLVFVLGQFFLAQALSGRDKELGQLSGQIADLGRMLSLEKQAHAELEQNIGRLTDQLTDAKSQIDALSQLKLDLSSQLAGKTAEADSRAKENSRLKQSLTQATELNNENQATIASQVQELALLHQSVKAMEAYKAQLEKDVAARTADVGKEKQVSVAAQAEAALMSQQLQDMQNELARLTQALDASDKLTAEQKAQVSDLGRRMNRALAGKVQELQRYRSEFFGRLRDILGEQPGITIVGDRFVFQSEVLFSSASAEIGPDGQRQLTNLAHTLLDLAKQIPPEVNWILRVDGHTDTVPIKSAVFTSNWELSTARALAVVKFLISQGVPPERLAAAGFGEFQPIDPASTPAARAHNRRIELKLDQR